MVYIKSRVNGKLIAFGPYKKGEKVNFSPSVYDKHSIWSEYYQMCKYYYDKRTR